MGTGDFSFVHMYMDASVHGRISNFHLLDPQVDSHEAPDSDLKSHFPCD